MTTTSDGDAFTTQMVGFDYPAYAASYPNSLKNASPSLVGVGASRQADITVSSQVVFNLPLGGPLTPGGALPAGVPPLSHARR